MPLSLGVMPLNLRKLVERWIDDGRRTNAANFDSAVMHFSFTVAQQRATT